MVHREIRFSGSIVAPSTPVENPEPPIVTIAFRNNGPIVNSPLRYLGWKIPDGYAAHFHCWLVLNEGPYGYAQGDRIAVVGGTVPNHVKINQPEPAPALPPAILSIEGGSDG